MVQTLEKIPDFSQKEEKLQPENEENELEGIIKTNFRTLKECAKIEKLAEIETIEELENNYNSLQDIFNQETQQEFKKTLPPQKKLTPEAKTAFNSLPNALTKAYQLAFSKISLGLLDNELSENDILEANKDLKLLADNFSSLINGNLLINEEKNSKITSTSFCLFFLNPALKDEEIELIIKPESINEPSFYQEGTVNLRIKKKENEKEKRELSIRLDESEHGLGIDISSKNLDKVFGIVDKIVQKELKNEKNLFYPLAKVIKENSPLTHHFNTLDFNYTNKEKFKNLEASFKIFAERFENFIKIKYHIPLFNPNSGKNRK